MEMNAYLTDYYSAYIHFSFLFVCLSYILGCLGFFLLLFFVCLFVVVFSFERKGGG